MSHCACGTPLATMRRIADSPMDGRMSSSSASPSQIPSHCGIVAPCGMRRFAASVHTHRSSLWAARTTCGTCIGMRRTCPTLAIAVLSSGEIYIYIRSSFIIDFLSFDLLNLTAICLPLVSFAESCARVIS